MNSQKIFTLSTLFALSALLNSQQVYAAVCDATTDVGGNVFFDLPVDGAATANTYGVKDGNEFGLEGITVTVVDAVGTSRDATTENSGDWVVSGATFPVRVQFSWNENWLKNSPDAAESKTSLQFIAASGCSVSLGLHDPSDYSQTNPDIALTSYINGSGEGSGDPGLVSTPYTSSGLNENYFDNAKHITQGPIPSTDATVDEIGSAWGAAWQVNKKRLFLSTFVKRHVGMADGPGYVYVKDYSATSLPLAKFNLAGVTPNNGGDAINLGTICRDATCGTEVDNVLSVDKGTPSIDLDAFAKVGAMSFGDIEVQPSSDTLWLVNLEQKALVTVDVKGSLGTGTDDHLVGATINQYHLTGANKLLGVPVCTNGQLRPWALSFSRGKGYLGIVCDGSTFGNRDDLKAHVLSFNPANISAGLSDVFSLDLDYKRAKVFGDDSEDFYQLPSDADGQKTGKTLNKFYFYAWVNDETQPWTLVDKGRGYRVYYPQPILSDIEFDPAGNMYLNIMDRLGHQYGYANYRAETATTDLVNSESSGDLLKVCHSANGFVLEGGSGCNINYGVDAHYTGAVGPFGTGEFFDDIAGDWNPESANGALLSLMGSDQIVSVQLDPHLSGEFSADNKYPYFFTQGITTFDLTDGSAKNWYSVNYSGETSLFGKANGLGDIEILSDPAPIEIGNRVWLDTNDDGIQGAAEVGISGVKVTLHDSDGVLVSTATTDATGNYIFSSDPNGDVGTGASSHRYNITEFKENKAYQIRVLDITDAAQQPALVGYVLTQSNIGQGADADRNDSDGITNDGNAVAAVLASDIPTIGANNHSLDFGFKVIPPCSINTPVIVTSCSNNGTALDSSDDVFSYTINASGTNVSENFVISGGDARTSVDYGAVSASFGSFPISSGNLTLTVTDTGTNTCLLGNITVTAPATCSNVIAYDFGDAPDIYLTTDSVSGAKHKLSDNLYLGTCVDDEADGSAGSADGDDNSAVINITHGTCATGNDDEDSLTPPALTDEDVTPTIAVATVNNTGADAYLACWVDYSGLTGFDSGERSETVTVADGTTSVNVILPNVPNNANDTTGGSSYMRCRLASTEAEIADPSGTATSGEVEDYPVTISAIPLIPLDLGDAPTAEYSTLLADTGPSHIVSNDLYMGACVDDETDGQPTATAHGDDTSAASLVTAGTCLTTNKDEDSLTPPLFTVGQVAPSVTVTTVNTTDADAYLACWVDYSGVGFEATERSDIVTVINNATSAVVTFPNVPTNANSNTGGSSFMRCRLASTASDIELPTGKANDGEVEDYPITIKPSLDLGDAPDSEYYTLLSNNGPSHRLDTDLYMGSCVDNDVTGLPTDNANGDDTGIASGNTHGTCAIANDDEDSLTPPALTDEQIAPTVTVTTVNTTGNDAYLACWVDYSGSGGFQQAERSNIVTVANEDTTAIITLPNVPANTSTTTDGSSFMRCRLASTASDIEIPTGPAANGEIEDYPVIISALSQDLGDAPDSDTQYRTSLERNGPRHTLDTQLYMGSCVDNDTNGQPSNNADGDDDTGVTSTNTLGTCATENDDEDSLTPPALTDGQISPTVTVKTANTTGAGAYLACWVDYSGKDGFQQAERSATVTVASGDDEVTVTLPTVPANTSTTTQGSSFMRCRLASTASDIELPTGKANNGEVEDYPITIKPSLDLGDAPDSEYYTLLSNNGPSHRLDTDLYMGSCVDNDVTGLPTDNANGDDTGIASGNTHGTCAIANDDEDSLTPPALTDEQIAPTVTVTTVNTTGNDAYLACWVDYSGSGGFQQAERSNIVTVANEDTTAIITLPNVPANTSTTTDGSSFMRCRLASTASDIEIPTGPAANGEIEDYPVIISALSQDLGDAPDSDTQYRTSLERNGPRHTLDTQLYMGSCVDNDTNGQPSNNADGDDDTGVTSTNTLGTCATENDDEDSLTPPALTDGQISPTVTVKTANTTGAGAYLACWVDYSGKDGFQQAERSATVTVASGDDEVTVTLPTVPANTSTTTQGSSFMRCRLASTESEIKLPTGKANNGEVEDYPVTISIIPVVLLDWGDAPSSDYPTLSADTGPNHVIDNTLYMGGCIDNETDAQPTDNAEGDNNGSASSVTEGTCITENNDEDSLTPPALTDGQIAPTVIVTTVNTTGEDAYLACWMDYSGSGFEAAERSATVIVTNNATSAVITLPNVPTNANSMTAGSSFMRCRLASTETEINNPTGEASDGEIEDYPVTVNAMLVDSLDWGDAPSEHYPTLVADEGPRHVINDSLYMGVCVDDETDGQPTAMANGDDTGAASLVTAGTCVVENDDDDSLTPPALTDGVIAPMVTIATVNNTGNDAYLTCWIDYSGTEFQLSERSSMVTVFNGANSVNVTLPNVPSDASTTTGGSTFMRCRLASSMSEIKDPTGKANNGEIEDYLVTILSDEAEARVTGVVFLDKINNGVQDDNEDGLEGFTVELTNKVTSTVTTFKTTEDGVFGKNVVPSEYTIRLYSPGGIIIKEQTITLKAGETFPVIEPIDPAGVLYDEDTGEPLIGGSLHLTDKDGVDLPAVCLEASEQGQVTGANGSYAFFLRPGADVACPFADTLYKLTVNPPTGYQLSENYLPQPNILDADNCTIDAEPSTVTCEISNQAAAPISGHPEYYIQIELGAGDPGIFNNNIPLKSTGTSPLTPNSVNPVVPATPAKPIPTLDEWARLLLMMMLGMMGYGYYERKQRRFK